MFSSYFYKLKSNPKNVTFVIMFFLHKCIYWDDANSVVEVKGNSWEKPLWENYKGIHLSCESCDARKSVIEDKKTGGDGSQFLKRNKIVIDLFQCLTNVIYDFVVFVGSNRPSNIPLIPSPSTWEEQEERCSVKM